MNKAELKAAVTAAVDGRRQEIIEIGEKIRRNPELGYKEHQTATLVEEQFTRLGLEYENGLAITGSKARIKGALSKVSLAVMGELDAVLCPEHPEAHPETGAAHSCGHNAQLAAMLAVGMALKDTGAMAHLAGDVVLMAVPAEEPVEVEWRQRLREKGKISFLGGKQEFIKLGVMDDVDMTVMFHSSITQPNRMASVGGTANGFVAKFIKYTGKEAHAGGAPHLGVNALNAAILGLQAIHANRETLKDDDTIRIHPIITKGGDLVNIIPADVRMETYVRGKSMEAILDASKKVNRALKAGAMAVGAEVDIIEIPGFLPRVSNPRMDELMRENLHQLLGADNVATGTHGTGSSDIGDIMHIMPAIHPYVAGAVGAGHTKNYQVEDPELFYIVPAKAMAMTVIDLLYGDAAEAQEIIANYPPAMTKEEYLRKWEELCAEVDG
ncbi:MAG TPA: amidohydrolase [Bacillota bacterium]|nr:amidohydrolase [Bacillota bacterium]